MIKEVKVLLVQQTLHKTLQGKSSKPVGMSDEDQEEMDLKTASMKQICLAEEIMYNIVDEETTTRLLSRLETLYMTKNLSNKRISRNNYMGYV